MVVARLGDARFRSLFADLATTTVVLIYVDDRTQLVAAALAHRPIAVLLPLRDAAGITCAPLAARLCAEAPDVHVITFWHPMQERSDLIEAIRAGSDLFPVASAADVARCISGLRGTGAPSAAELDAVRALLADVEPEWLMDVILACVRWAHRGLSVGDLAEVVGFSRRTLGRQSVQAGWPAPEEFIEWGRLLRASLVQWRDQATLAALAHASGFSGPQALHRTANRLLGENTALPGALTPLGVSAALHRRLTRRDR